MVQTIGAGFRPVESVRQTELFFVLADVTRSFFPAVKPDPLSVIVLVSLPIFPSPHNEGNEQPSCKALDAMILGSSPQESFDGLRNRSCYEALYLCCHGLNHQRQSLDI